MKLISTLIFLLCVTFAFAECYDNHFDECRIERQNGKYGIVIDKQLAIPYEYDEIVPQHNCFFKVRKGRKYGIISYFYEEHKRDGRFPKEIDRPIALKKGMPGFTFPSLVNTIRSKNMKISIFKSAATTGKELSIITGPWSCPAVLKK